MRDYDRLQALARSFLQNREGFSWWYALLKQCFPVPDYVLAFWVGVYPSHFSLWKRGKRKPGKAAIQCIALLCLVRVGGPVSIADLINLSTAIASGKFEKRVVAYLKHEREVLARRAAKKAAKEASTSTKSSTIPGETA